MGKKIIAIIRYKFCLTGPIAYFFLSFRLGNGQVVHLAGEGDDDGLKNNITSGNFFTISGVRFNKALVKVDEFFNVAHTSKAKKNNNKDRKLRYCIIHKQPFCFNHYALKLK